MAFPFITPDEVERFTISDKLTQGSVTFKDFDIQPHTVEETIIRFVGMFRPHEFAHAPNEPLLKKYSTKGGR